METSREYDYWTCKFPMTPMSVGWIETVGLSHLSQKEGKLHFLSSIGEHAYFFRLPYYIFILFYLFIRFFYRK